MIRRPCCLSARPDVISSNAGYLELLEMIRRPGGLGARPGCLELFRLSRGRLESSRAARLSRAASGYLELFRLSRGRLELSRAARLSREGSGYLERSGYLEGGFEITRASRWLGPLRMTRSAQDDSVRYETSHVPRHCKVAVGDLPASIVSALQLVLQTVCSERTPPLFSLDLTRAKSVESSAY